ncbi:MAG TPA: hypothetical protein VM165_20550 [Planctomycetaceae bacterium]|nr:hypothetical protein [Planctomycetaceae bacterium]
MGVVIGIDEAGLGPNLGPFVVTAIAWEVPGHPSAFDLAGALADMLTDDPASEDGRLVVADSKLLFQPRRSVGVPERSVLAMLGSWCDVPGTLRQLDARLQPDGPRTDDPPWLFGRDLDVPLDTERPAVDIAAARLRGHTAARVKHVESRIVQPAEFNRRLQSGNKAAVTSGYHLEVLLATCQACGDDDVLVLSDKHGGRNAYGAMLCGVWNGAWIDILTEGALLSAYRVGRVECRFEPRAERHLPVAMASMISKYIREAHMRLFNRFWAEHLPNLRPTQGYPDDARRFAADIAACQTRLGIPHDQLWRMK